MPNNKKLRFSSFFMTINTQKHFEGDEHNFESEQERLTNKFDSIINEENMENWIKFMKTDFDRSKIRDITVFKAIELGRKSKGRKLHIHAYIVINHYTVLRINNNYIRQEMNNEYKTKIHLNNQLVTNREHGRAILNYMQKGQPSKIYSYLFGGSEDDE